MLAVQVQYWTLQENIRHNKAQDTLGYMTLNEQIRHNVVTEGETNRHNEAQELYWSNSLAETSRHNTAQENYWYDELRETQRHNIANEALTQESNDIARINAYTNQINAATSRMNAETNIANLALQGKKIEYDYELGSLNYSVNRYNAQANYNLGLTANEVAAQNANTNERKVNLEFLEYGNASRNASSRSKDASSNALNASTNVTRALTEQTKVDLGYKTLELDQNRFNWQKIRDIGDFYLKAADTGNKIFSNVLRYIGQ